MHEKGEKESEETFEVDLIWGNEKSGMTSDLLTW